MPTVSSSKAFTLFELLLVIVLIGLMYGIFVHKLTRPATSKTDALNLINLKSFMLEFPFKKKAEVICLEPCSECHFYADNKQITEEPLKLFKSSPKVYFPDRFGQVRAIDFLPVLDENDVLHNVCFKFSVYNNKSSSHYAVESEGTYYLFDPYMQPVKATKSFNDVSAFFDVSKLLPMEKRDYDH